MLFSHVCVMCIPSLIWGLERQPGVDPHHVQVLIQATQPGVQIRLEDDEGTFLEIAREETPIYIIIQKKTYRQRRNHGD